MPYGETTFTHPSKTWNSALRVTRLMDDNFKEDSLQTEKLREVKVLVPEVR